MTDEVSAVQQGSVTQCIQAPVYGPVAGRDVNIYTMPWQWYSQQDSATLEEWRADVIHRINTARKRILLGPTGKIGWFAIAALSLLLIAAIINFVVGGFRIPVYLFSSGVILLFVLAVQFHTKHERNVDFAIIEQGKKELLRIDMELRARMHLES